MATSTIRRSGYMFCAAHQLVAHPKCGRVHGHNYLVTVTISGKVNFATGMIMDYGDLDRIVKPVIDTLDHCYIVSNANRKAGNKHALLAIEENEAIILPIEQSTAEEISLWLAKTIQRAIDVDVLIGNTVSGVVVDVEETPKSNAHAEV